MDKPSALTSASGISQLCTRFTAHDIFRDDIKKPPVTLTVVFLFELDQVIDLLWPKHFGGRGSFGLILLTITMC